VQKLGVCVATQHFLWFGDLVLKRKRRQILIFTGGGIVCVCPWRRRAISGTGSMLVPEPEEAGGGWRHDSEEDNGYVA
jgi:hypothetical protein